MTASRRIPGERAFDIGKITRRFTKHTIFGGPLLFQGLAILSLILHSFIQPLILTVLGACIVSSLIIGTKAYTTRVARQYYLLVGLVSFFSSLALLLSSLALLACHLLRYDLWVIVLVCGYMVNCLGIGKLYRPIWDQTFSVDQDSGRIDLVSGTMCPIIPQTTFHFRNPILERISIIAAANGILAASLGGIVGMRMQQSPFKHKEIILGLLIYLLAVLLLFVVMSNLYTYRFIRRWEKQTGRTMWIKGFEPKDSHQP